MLTPSLSFPHRFDKLLYLGVPEIREDQLNIVKALTRKYAHLSLITIDLFNVCNDDGQIYGGPDDKYLLANATYKCLKQLFWFDVW